MKKGFTLIELIGAVIVLGLMAIIAFPVILNSIRKTEIQLSEAERTIVFDGANSYITKHQNSFKKTTGNVYCLTIGDLIINDMIPSNLVSDISKNTFIKVDVVDEKYEYSLVESCTPQASVLDIVLSVVGSPFNNQGWANEGFYINAVGTGQSYKYCASNEECIPQATVNSPNGAIYVSNDSATNYVCAQAISDNSESEVICIGPYKLDKQSPTISPKDERYIIFSPGTSATSLEYFSYSNQGISEIINTSCDINNISSLEIGNHAINCTVTKENGKSTTASKIIGINDCFDISNNSITNYKCYVGNTEGYLESGDVVIPYSINGMVVEAISDFTDYELVFNSKSITSVDFSNATDLKRIGYQSFQYNQIESLDLSNLTKLTYLAGFEWNRITSIDLSELVNLQVIDQAFDYNRLTTVNLQNLSNLKEIGYASFRGNKLSEIDFDDLVNLSTIGADSFSYNQISEVNFPSKVTAIYDHAFDGNSITSVNFPEGLTYLGGFSDNNLTNVVIPSTVNYIAEGAFYKSSGSNSQLSTIQNKANVIFDWGTIINGYYNSSYHFATGTVVNSVGNVEITN